MKQKQLIKRGLAAVLSATMALSLAPNVGLLSVPAMVKAEDVEPVVYQFGDGEGTISKATAINGKTNPKGTTGAYFDEKTGTVYLSVDEDDAITLELVGPVGPLENADVLIPDGLDVEADVAYEDDVNKLTITTAASADAGNDTIEIDPDTETQNDEVTLKLVLGYTVKFNYNDGAGDPPAPLVYKDGASIALPGAVSKTNCTFKSWTDDNGETEYVAGKSNYAVDAGKADENGAITLKALYYKNITINSDKLKALAEEVDGLFTKPYDTKKDFIADLNEEGNDDLVSVAWDGAEPEEEPIGIKLTGEYDDAAVSEKVGVTITKAEFGTNAVAENEDLPKEYKIILAPNTKFADGEILPGVVDGTVDIYKGKVAVGTDNISLGDELRIVSTIESIDNLEVTYQWYRVKGESSEKITGATGTTYTITEADAEGVYVIATPKDKNYDIVASDTTGDMTEKVVRATGFKMVEGGTTYNKSNTHEAAVELTVTGLPTGYKVIADAEFNDADADSYLTDIVNPKFYDASGKEITGVYKISEEEDGNDDLGDLVAADAHATIVTRIPVTISVGDLKLYTKYSSDTVANAETINQKNANGTFYNDFNYEGVLDGEEITFETIDEVDPATNKEPGEYNVSVKVTLSGDVENYSLNGKPITGENLVVTMKNVPLTIVDGTIPEISDVEMDTVEAIKYAYDSQTSNNKIDLTATIKGDELTENNAKVKWSVVDSDGKAVKDGVVTLSNESFKLDSKEQATAKVTVTINKHVAGGIKVVATNVEDKSKTGVCEIALETTENINVTTSVSGVERVGEKLTASAELIFPYAGTPDFYYTWFRVKADGTGDPEAVSEASESSQCSEYTLTAEDKGYKIMVGVVDDPRLGEGEKGYTVNPSGVIPATTGVIADEAVLYTVSFSGANVESQKVEAGKTATKPADPTKEGFTFDGWYTDEALTTAYDFSTPVTEDITIYAKWTEAEPEVDPTPVNPEPEVDPTPVNPEPEVNPTPSTDTTTGSSTDVTPSGSGSGGSGGGGGSSNAKTVKNSDGSTTTTTTTANGTIETTTKTNADGSKTTSKVVKNKDGSGSVTETSVSAAGTTKVVEVVTDTTGAATEVTTTVSNANGASMKVTYAAKGTAITVSKVETTNKTAVSIPATVKVGGKTYKVTKIAASALKGNKDITKVTLGKNVKAIGKNAFNGDSKLKTIVMKKAPTTVGKNAFKGIAKKATIKIKATKKAFKAAKKLIKKSGVASTVKIKRTK